MGDLIIYLLSPNQQPTNPLWEWHGRVEQVSDEAVRVLSLNSALGMAWTRRTGER